MVEKITVVWNDHSEKEAEHLLKKYGELDNRETEVNSICVGFADWAVQLVAEAEYERDCEAFRSETTINVVGPDWAAGRYDIYIDYEPRFLAALSRSRRHPTTAG